MNNRFIAVLCYSQIEFWSDREKAKQFYLECMSGSEGSERDRYTNIYLMLNDGAMKCWDEGELEFDLAWTRNRFYVNSYNGTHIRDIKHTMRKRKICIGDFVYDCSEDAWGYVDSINHKVEDAELQPSDEAVEIVLREHADPEDHRGNYYWKTNARQCYSHVGGLTFHGERVCIEHDITLDYPYYCPALDDNCLANECIKNY